jgi:serine/threonine protein kinase/Flp pilus assembly protein TadD
MTVPILSESDVPLTERLPGPPQLIASSGVAVTDPLGLPAAARAYHEFRRRSDGDVDAWGAAWVGDPRNVELFRVLHRRNPDAALKLADAAISLPGVGDRFAGFRLVSELGRGAFGRVFLAEQPDLGDRPVVLKVSVEVKAEALALARLLHTNIVPVYSVHRAGTLQAVCMPYWGGTTLAHAVHRLRGDTVPDSGRELVTLLHSSAASNRPAAPGSSDTLPVLHPPSSTTVLELLGGLSYVDAILWVGARLADALAHAHDRGILHRDLKPANVLLTDEGQPLLLDFNLATDTRFGGIAEAARLGGTLPYMAPEHIESFSGQARRVDARGDLYSLGVILFELLTGRPPFRLFKKATPDALRQMVADRQAVPRMRDRNPAVSPAVEAIVRKCLDPDPGRRYATGHDLQEDLERQLHHQPLRHISEPSRAERARKWSRRHPRLTSFAFLGTCAALLLAVVTGIGMYQRERRLALEAREAFTAFQADSRRARLSLAGMPGGDRRSATEAANDGRRALARYPAPDDPAWADSPAVARLNNEDRRQLREDVGILLMMLAHVTAQDAAGVGDALRLNEQAVGCFPPDAVPRAVCEQRAELLERVGRAVEAPAWRGKATAEPGSARDLYLAAWTNARRGRYSEAIPLLENATRVDPAAPWAWYLLGQCHDGLGRDADAIASYSACLALEPNGYQVWFNRGLANLRRGDFKNASTDFDRVLQLNPVTPDAYFNRALAKRALKDYVSAERDLTKALDSGTALTRVYFVRADVRARRGDAAGAAADRREGLSREPVEESCWTARGFARIDTDPNGAIHDFDRALERNPRYRPALVNKAHVLADMLRRPDDAIAVLDLAIANHPEQADLRAARAVYLARLDRRADAHQEAEQALNLSSSPATRYQVAGVYALTSKTNAEDRKEALRLLALALQRDYGFEHLDRDPELEPIRHLPEFREVVAAARALRGRP